jgi:hypothetical protein
MANKFKLVDVEYQDDGTFGVVKDTYISSANPTYSYGDAVNLRVGKVDWGSDRTKIIVEIQMPSDKDIVGFDEIEKVELILYIQSKAFVSFDDGLDRPLWWIDIAITEIPDDFDEDVTGVGWCNWNYRIMSVPWSRSNGAVKSNFSFDESDEPIFDTNRGHVALALNSEHVFDITTAITKDDKKRFALFVINYNGVVTGANKAHIGYHSNDATGGNFIYRPKLRITYRDYTPEGFDTIDNRLKVVPNPVDRRLPIFSWGEVSADDLEQYKFYWKAFTFTLPTNATWLATILDTSLTTYLGVDADLVPENTARYYRMIAEDENNLNADALISNIVSFIRPEVLETEANRNATVGDVVSLTTVKTNAGTPVKKVYIDWGDSTGYWMTMETEFTTVGPTLTHVYSKKGVYAVKVQFEGSAIDGDEEIGGYWSDLTDICTVTVADTYPRALLTARPLEVIYGERIRLNASLSHPISADETLTYRFYKDGAPLDVYQASPIYSYASVIGDIPHAHFTCYVKTSGGIESALSNDEIVYVIADAPTLLSFSHNTKITSRGESRQSTVDINQIDGGSGEIDVRSGLSNITISLEGISAKADMAADLAILKAAVSGYSYVQLKVYDESCGSTVNYNGRMISYRLNKTSARYVSWSVEFRINSVT